MNRNEFNEKVRRTERNGRTVLDVTPLGNLQREAVSFYLKLRASDQGTPEASVILVCERRFDLLGDQDIRDLLERLNMELHRETEIQNDWAPL